MDAKERHRRLKAARAYAGFSREALGERMGYTGQFVYTLESDKEPREANEMELREIARLCGVPYEFFVAPLARLVNHPALDERLDQIEARINSVAEAVRPPAEDRGEGHRQSPGVPGALPSVPSPASSESRRREGES